MRPTAQQRERAALARLTQATSRYVTVLGDSMFFDGWRSPQPDADGTLFKKAVQRWTFTSEARETYNKALAAYARAIRRTVREQEGT